MSPVTVLLEFFVHLPQLGVIPNSPAPRLEGTTCRQGGRHWCWGIRGCFQNLIFWNPKNEKGECCWLADPKHVFTRKIKKGVDEFRFQESKHKETKTWLFQWINQSRWSLNQPVWKKNNMHIKMDSKLPQNSRDEHYFKKKTKQNETQQTRYQHLPRGANWNGDLTPFFKEPFRTQTRSWYYYIDQLELVGDSTQLNKLVKLDHFPKDRDEKTYLKPQPRTWLCTTKGCSFNPVKYCDFNYQPQLVLDFLPPQLRRSGTLMSFPGRVHQGSLGIFWAFVKHTINVYIYIYKYSKYEYSMYHPETIYLSLKEPFWYTIWMMHPASTLDSSR